jgi:hypothetical protein
VRWAWKRKVSTWKRKASTSLKLESQGIVSPEILRSACVSPCILTPTAESHVQRSADTTVHACTSAEQHSWRASGGPLQDPCRHDATTPQETLSRTTGSSEMRLQELHVLTSRPDDRRKDLPSTIPDLTVCVLDPRRSVLRCVESGRARSACKFSHPPNSYQRRGTKCRRLVPPPYLLAKHSEISRVASFHVHYHVTGWLSI